MAQEWREARQSEFHGERLVSGACHREESKDVSFCLHRTVLCRGGRCETAREPRFGAVLPRLGSRAHGPREPDRCRAARGSVVIPPRCRTILAAKGKRCECRLTDL